MAQRIPLPWRQLTFERMKLLTAMAGVMVAVMLMWVQLGILAALYSSATEVHRHVRAFAPQTPRERHVLEPPPPAAAMPNHDDFRHVRVRGDNRRRQRFDHVEDAGRRKARAQRANDGRRENDVPDQARTHEQKGQRVRVRPWPHQ